METKLHVTEAFRVADLTSFVGQKLHALCSLERNSSCAWQGGSEGTTDSSVRGTFGFPSHTLWFYLKEFYFKELNLNMSRTSWNPEQILES